MTAYAGTFFNSRASLSENALAYLFHFSLQPLAFSFYFFPPSRKLSFGDNMEFNMRSSKKFFSAFYLRKVSSSNQTLPHLGLSALAMAMLCFSSQQSFSATIDLSGNPSGSLGDYISSQASGATQIFFTEGTFRSNADDGLSGLDASIISLTGASLGANNAPATVFDGNSHKILAIRLNPFVSISKITFRNAVSDSEGGAIFDVDDLTGNLKYLIFTNNASKTASGGAIYIQGALTGDVTDSIFISNKSGEAGSAIYLNGDLKKTSGGAVDFSNTKFFNNESEGSPLALGGGAISARQDLSIIAKTGNVIFAGNTTKGEPEAIYFRNFALPAGNGTGSHVASISATESCATEFYDPIDGGGSQFSLNFNDAEGALGTVLFDGAGTNLQSNIHFTVATVHSGIFELQNGAVFGANDNAGTFTVAPGATLEIAYEQQSPVRDANNHVELTEQGDAVTLNTTIASSAWHTVAYDANHIARINGNLFAQNANLEFVLPSTIHSGNTLSEVSGSANVDGAKVIVSVAGNQSLKTFGNNASDYLNLIKANSMTGMPVSLVEVKAGSSLQGIYAASVEDGTTLVIRQSQDSHIQDIAPKNPAMTFPESWLGGMNFLNMGSDFLADQGMRSMLDAGKMRQGINAFGVVGGGRLKALTGDGHVTTRGVNLLAGAAYRSGCRVGICDGGVFLEYGRGNYSSETTPMLTIDASGDLHYAGVGVMGRMEFRHSEEQRQYAWAEGSLRMGRLTNDYDSSDVDISFNASAMYLGAYLGGGYWLTPSSHTRLDAYGKFFWNRIASKHINADDDTDEGISVNFHAVNSMRARVGGRLYYDTGSAITPYAGLAYEYAFGGKAKSDTEDVAIAAPALKGSVGSGELGFRCEPAGFKKDLLIDLSATGYAGKRQGVVGVLKLRYRF
jgi:predicted outer membrane repeat protein